jgi:50S ribosomal subunit-associated GTPase HflX
MDLPGASEHLGAFRAQFPQLTVVPVSAKRGTGVDEVKRLLEKRLAPAPEEEAPIQARQAINK